MEAFEATRSVFTRVQTVDPENASKIMGYILLHHGEKDMIRFAYGPETLISSIVNRAKSDLGLSSNTLSAPAVVSPISNPISISRPNPLSLSLPSPRGFNPSSPSPTSVWSNHHNSLSLSLSLSPSPSPNNGGGVNLSYAAAVNGTCNNSNGSPQSVDFFDQNMDLAALNSGPFGEGNGHGNVHFHRRSLSFNDSMYYGTDDSTSGFGYKPCLYFARGFCKNGSACKFVHGGGFPSEDNNNNPLGAASPCKYDAFDQCQEEILRSKFAHQQRLAQLMAYNKSAAAAALMMSSEEFHKLNRVRMARNDFSVMGIRGDSNPGSRQIYLTFPADSTFKEEDVSEYFSRFGPVQDVRIPYQQKRMFGFVTFVYPETVNMILAKGNPHFVCDSRVLVKPYKEKGKLPDKKQHQQQMERGEFSCSSPSGLDCRDPYDLQLGGRMFYSTQDMMMKKKLEEQADLHQTLELHGRRLMNLQILDMKNQLSQASSTLNASFPSNGMSQDASEENKGSPTGLSDQQLPEGENFTVGDVNGKVENNEETPNGEEFELCENLEHILPDNLFASPTKSASEHRSSILSPGVDGANCDSSSISAASPLNMSPHKSCFFEMPRLSAGQGALGM